MGKIGGKTADSFYEEDRRETIGEMEKITPIDVLKREFKTAWKGYGKQEVRNFLEQTSRAMESMVHERNRLLDEIGHLQERLNSYMTLEETLQKTLLTAQQTYEEVTANAKREAELIMADARMRAERLETEIASKRAVREAFIVEFDALLGAFRDRMKNGSHASQAQAAPHPAGRQVSEPEEADAELENPPSFGWPAPVD